MIAGRELDALVAERVMGWTLTTPVDPACDFAVGTKRDGTDARRNFGRGPDGKEVSFPLYSTDIAAAWQVVEKLRADGYEVQVAAEPDPRVSAYHCEIARLSDSGSTVEFDDTAPLAICRAALAAVEVSA